MVYLILQINMFRKAIITGATGMIASALIRVLVENGIEVAAICRPSSAKLSNIIDSELVKIYEADVSDLLSLKDKIPKGDVFYHFAWGGTFGKSRNDCDGQLRNIEYTLNAVELAANLGCNTFIGAGSQAEYGRKNVKLTAFTDTNPENAYGAAKLAAGHLSRVKAQNMGMRHIWARILSVYGPGDNPYTILTSSIEKLISDKYADFTKGEQEWDFLYCDDAASALFKMGVSGRNGAVYPLGSGETRHLSEFIEIMRDCVDPTAEINLGGIPYNDKQVMYLCADISDLKKDTGFEPQVSFEEGIQRTVEWVRNNRK